MDLNEIKQRVRQEMSKVYWLHSDDYYKANDAVIKAFEGIKDEERQRTESNRK